MLQKIKNLFKSTCEDELRQLEMNVKELVDEVVSLRVKLEERVKALTEKIEQRQSLNQPKQ